MFEAKYSKILTVLLVIIIIAIIGIFGYLGYSYYKKYTISNDADKYVSTYVEETKNTTTESQNNTTTTENSDGNISGELATVNTSSSNSSNKVKTYKGYNVLGTIEIPKTNVKYPVLEGPSDNRLEVAVAVDYPYKDVKLNTVGNVTIAGHNYRNGTFFSDNNKLSNGDKIYITDSDGKKLEYVVYNKFIADFKDRSYDNRDTDGKKEITLYSCTDDMAGRLIVEARAE